MGIEQKYQPEASVASVKTNIQSFNIGSNPKTVIDCSTKARSIFSVVILKKILKILS